MTLVIPPGFGQASIQFTNESDPDPWYITFGVDLGDAGGDYDAVFNTIVEGFAESFLPDISNGTAVTGVRLTVGVDGPDNLTLFTSYNLPGSSTGAKLPQNCALLVDKVTLAPGRKGKGRLYIPSILTETAVNPAGVIDGATVSGLQTSANSFLALLALPETPLPSAPAPMVLLHNAYTPQPAPTPVQSLRVQSVIATQRRRLR